MKILSLFGVFLVFATIVSALEINADNWQTYENKEIIFLPIESDQNYEIGKNTFQRYQILKNKNALVKRIENKKGVINLTLEIPLSYKTKIIKVKDTKIIIPNMELKEEADKRVEERESKLKDKFLNKKIMSSYFDVYNIEDISLLSRVDKYKEFPTYKLKTDKSKDIIIKEPYDLPKEYAFVNEKGFVPEFYKKENYYDKLEKITTTEFLNKLNNEYTSSVYFYVSKIKGKNIEKLNFVISYYNDTWLFISSAYLYIDGKKEKLNIGKSRREVDDGISEYFSFPTTKEQIEKIIKSKEVVLRLIGQDYYEDEIFTPQNFYNFKRFYNEEIK